MEKQLREIVKEARFWRRQAKSTPWRGWSPELAARAQGLMDAARIVKGIESMAWTFNERRRRVA